MKERGSKRGRAETKRIEEIKGGKKVKKRKGGKRRGQFLDEGGDKERKERREEEKNEKLIQMEIRKQDEENELK